MICGFKVKHHGNGNNFLTSVMIRLSKSFIGEDEKSSVLEVLDKGYLGMGEEVKKFEDELSNFFNRQVVCVANGTAAIQLSLQASNIGMGDEVIVPSLTYLATFQAISATGATPIPAEINKKTLCLDFSKLSEYLSERTKAIIPVHYAGDPSGIDEIYKFSSKNNLQVIEDAAHAFGSIINGRKVGSFGDISCFSFDGIKNITSGEGGCIVSDKSEVINRIKNLRLLGVDGESSLREINRRKWNFDVTEQGWRFHMSNIMAAIGRAQLKKFSNMASVRQRLAKYYDRLLKDFGKVDLFCRNYDEIVPHIYVLKIKSSNRDYVRKEMLERGVETGIHYQPNHQLSLYKNNLISKLNTTEMVSENILTLPLHPDLTEIEIDYIVGELIDILNSEPI